MAYGKTRSMAARVAALLGCLCGILGLLAGATGHTWKLGLAGWFLGGSLLTLLGVFMLIEGALAGQRR
jgi:hypothetical protein